MDARPRQYGCLTGVLPRTAAQQRLVASEGGEFACLREFNRLQPARGQYVGESRYRRSAGTNLDSYLDWRNASKRIDERLECRQPSGAGEMAQTRRVEDQRWVHASGSNSRLHASSGTSSCAGSSQRLTVPHRSSAARASVSFPRR